MNISQIIDNFRPSTAITLAAGEHTTVNQTGRYFILKSNSLATEVQVAIGNSQHYTAWPVLWSFQTRSVDDFFEKIKFYNPAGVPMTIDFFISSDWVDVNSVSNITMLETIQNVVHIDDNSSTITIDIAAGQKISEVTTVASITNVVHVDDNDGTVTVDGAVTIQEPLSVDDNGGSITVDGTVTAVDNGTAQPCIIITNAAADANTVGANHACKRVLIRAHTINTGLVWVDFNNAAVALACYPLAAGDSVGVPLTNTNLVNCLFKVANEKVTVVYTN